MSWIDAGRHWWRTLFDREQLAREMDDEMRFHLELEAMDQRASGHRAAVDAARRRFGHLSTIRERRRDAAGLSLLDRVTQDAGYALRQLVRAPGFTIAVALTLALGVGANATMFAIVDRVMLRAPEGIEADGVVQLRSWRTREGRTDSIASFSYAAYVDLRDLTDVFELVTVANGPLDVAIDQGEDAASVRRTLIGDDYFELLGVQPFLGRFFRREETREPAGAPVAVISHRLWRTHYGADPDVLGRTIRAGHVAFTIIGVAQEGFGGHSLQRTDLWLPIAGAPGLRYGGMEDWHTMRNTLWLQVYARLRPEVSGERAAARIDAAWAARRTRALPAGDSGPSAYFNSLIPAEVSSRPEYRVARMLTVVAILLLAVTVFNVANLLLARALARRREVAIRLALGVSRARLASLFLLDATLLAVLGGFAAVALAWAGIPVVRSVLFAGALTEDWSVDQRVILFSVGIAIVAGIAAGIVPAVQASRPALLDALRGGSREGGASYRSGTRRWLLIAQGALTVVLLSGTGLFVRSLQRIGQQQLGIDLDRVVVADFDGSLSGYSPEQVRQLFHDFRERARRIRGVRSASLSVGVPFEGQYGLPIAIPGMDSIPGITGERAPFIYAVTADFFATSGARIVAGRPLTDADDAPTAAPVAVVNQELARRVWPFADPLGQCFRILITGKTPDCIRVVGVVEDVREELTATGAVPQYFLPLSQSPGMMSELTLLVRAADRAAVSPVRAAVASAGKSLRPDMPYVKVRTLEDAVAPELRPWRLGASVFGLFGLLALTVAAVGTYSVVQFGVSQRQHELGVRIALGARRHAVARMVLAEALRSGMAAGIAGLIVVVMAGPLIREHLFRTSERDPFVLAVVVAVVVMSAILATLVPSWRASRIDPLTALKAE